MKSSKPTPPPAAGGGAAWKSTWAAVLLKLDPEAPWQGLWQVLQAQGWSFVSGCPRPTDVRYCPPGVGFAPPFVLRRNYFDSRVGVRRYLVSAQEEARKQPASAARTNSKKLSMTLETHSACSQTRRLPQTPRAWRFG